MRRQLTELRELVTLVLKIMVGDAPQPLVNLSTKRTGQAVCKERGFCGVHCDCDKLHGSSIKEVQQNWSSFWLRQKSIWGSQEFRPEDLQGILATEDVTSSQAPESV